MNPAPSRFGAPAANLALALLALLAQGCSHPVDGTPADERQLALDPSLPRFKQACDAGDFSAARQAAVELTRRFPSNGSAWNCVGYADDRIGLDADALRAYRKAVEVNPRHAKAWANLGLAMGKRRDYAGEIECYRRSLRLRPDHARTWYNLSMAARQAGREAEAVEAFRRFMRWAGPTPQAPPPTDGPATPGPAPAVASAGPRAFPAAARAPAGPKETGGGGERREEPSPKAVLAAPVANPEVAPAPRPPATSRPEGAAEDSRHAPGEKPEDPALWNDLGVAQASSGALEESLESFRRAIRFAAAQTAPRWNLSRAFLLLAEKDFKEGRSAQGLSHLREAVAACPEPGDLRVILVKLSVAMGNLPAAREDAAEMPREGDGVGGAWLSLGLALSARGQDREALDPLRAATQCLPNHTAAWHALGVVQARCGQLGEAAGSLARAAKLDPSNGVVLYHQGLVEARRKDWKQAVLFLRAAARRQPSAEVLEAALAAEEKGGSVTALTAICRETVARDPKNGVAWRILALASEGAGDPVAVAEAWGRAADLLPSDAECRNRQGVALARAGKAREARAAFEKGLAISPVDSALLGNLALALRRLGQQGEAEQVLSRLQKVDPTRAAEIASWWRASDRRAGR